MKYFKTDDIKILINGVYHFANSDGLFEVENEELATIFKRLGAIEIIKEKKRINKKNNYKEV